MNSKRLETKNNTVYWQYGNPKGSVIIFVHGFRGTHHGLELIASYLSEYRIIIPDLPGFGETKPLNNNHSIEDFSEWLHEYIKNLDLKEKPVLLGHSFGSIIAAGYAKNYADEISRLILVNPIAVPSSSRSKFSLTKIGLLYSNLGFKLPTNLAHKWQSAKLPTIVMTISNARTKDRKLRKFIHSEHLKHFSSFSDVRTLYQSMNASANNSVLQFASSINIDTLLITGAKDIISSNKEQDNLLEVFPNARMKTIENVGHLTHYETPDQVADLVRHFIKSS